MNGKKDGIAFFDEGPRDGTPVVLIHGFPFNHTMWRPQVEVLTKAYRVISYDLRGSGQSDVGGAQFTVETFVDDLLMLLDELKIERTVLGGLSLGGYIALRAVERNAERFGALILCDTKSEADGNEAKLKRAAAIRAIQKDGVEPFAAGFVKTVLAENTFRTDPALVEFVLSLIRANTPSSICGTLLALASRTDTTTALSAMKLPTLILVGEDDKLTPPAAAEAMSKLLPTAQWHRIPSAGHLSNLENPAVFNERLLAFLKDLKLSSR